MNLGNYIRQERKYKKLSLPDLAVKTGLITSSLSNIERGGNPTYKSLQAIIIALGLDYVIYPRTSKWKRKLINFLIRIKL